MIPHWYHHRVAMTLRLSDKQAAKLRAVAERDGISMHAAVLKAVDDYLDRRTARRDGSSARSSRNTTVCCAGSPRHDRLPHPGRRSRSGRSPPRPPGGGRRLRTARIRRRASAGDRVRRGRLLDHSPTGRGAAAVPRRQSRPGRRQQAHRVRGDRVVLRAQRPPCTRSARGRTVRSRARGGDPRTRHGADHRGAAEPTRG